MTFPDIGETVWDSDRKEWVPKHTEGQQPADLVLLRRLASEMGLEFCPYSWSSDPQILEDRTVEDETFFIDIQDASGNLESFDVVETRQIWFMEHIAPILRESGCKVSRRTVTTQSTKSPSIKGSYENTKWSNTTWSEGIPDGVKVDIESIDLTNGELVIMASSNGEDQNGAILNGPEVEEAMKFLHDCIIETLREFECWDESTYTRDCKTNLEAASIRVCDTAFLG